MSNVTITFPICLEALFFKDLGSGKYLKEISGCENVCIETIHNNLEIKVPCDINGHLSYFVFLVPTKIFGNKPVDLVTFFKKGLCKIEENPFWEKNSILVFMGDYEKKTKSLQGNVEHYFPGSMAWELN